MKLIFTTTAACCFMIYASAATVSVTSDDGTRPETTGDTDTEPTVLSRAERIKARARTIYGRGKANVINRATYYLVDYGLSLKALAMLYGQTPNNNTINDMQPQPSSNSTLNEADRAVISEAIHAFLKPLKTYQQAQQEEDTEKLSGSLVGVMDILLRKAKAAADDTGADNEDPKVSDTDYQPGEMWTTVVRKDDVNGVLAARDALFAAKPSADPAFKQEDRHRLAKIRDYYAMLNQGDTKFRKLIHKSLDWSRFQKRYVEVVETVLLRRPDLVRRCRVYLGRYLASGNSNEAYFRTLVAEASKQSMTAGASAVVRNSVLALVPFVLAALVLVF